jgi:predicted dehydrogenase
MAAELTIGMVGLDTSHCEVFAKILHNQEYEYHLPGARIVALYPGGSPQFSFSRERLPGYTETLHKGYGIKLVDSLPALAQEVDAILLESVDGRQHLAQFSELAAGKPVFIDKPFTCSAADARALIRQAQATNTPIFSCSSLRFAAGVADLVDAGETVRACEGFGPAVLLDDYPGLFWYGVHSVEMIYTWLGAGCRQVQCIARPEMDVVVGDWQDGRVGVMRGLRTGAYQFGGVVHTEQTVKCGLAQGTPPYYYRLMRAVLDFFHSGVPPVDPLETYEIMAFLDAAEQSRVQGGKVVALEPFA